MKVFFLEAGEPLTKQYRLVNNELQTKSYPHVSEFKSHETEVNSIQELYEAIKWHAACGHCLLKGYLSHPLAFESRAGSTNPDTPTEFIVLDVDGLPDHTPEQVMDKLNLGQIPHVLQYSSSQGISPKKGLSCHIFFLLTKPTPPSQIKQWLIQKNLEVFQDHLSLTASGVALHYPIDITACQNDKLIYIAPPICTPPSLDTFTQPRIQLHPHLKSAV